MMIVALVIALDPLARDGDVRREASSVSREQCMPDPGLHIGPN
jgi:hypothetical protein